MKSKNEVYRITWEVRNLSDIASHALPKSTNYSSAQNTYKFYGSGFPVNPGGMNGPDLDSCRHIRICSAPK